MTDLTNTSVSREHRRAQSWEYRFYFGIIFLCSLPWALVSWALGLARPDSEDSGKGFIARAWRQASIITPMIFSA